MSSYNLPYKHGVLKKKGSVENQDTAVFIIEHSLYR